MAKAKRGADQPTIIKKYANRRLYDTGRSSYVTLDDLCELVKENHDFVVQDAKSGEDITRSVLTQIIVDQESKGEENLLPTGFLRKLIGFYGGNVEELVPNYLEQTMDIFIKNQEQMRAQVNKSFEGMNSMQGMFPKVPGVPNVPGTEALEEMNRKNIEMFERTMKMFTPFAPGAAEQETGNENANTAAKAERMNALKKNIEELEKELNRMAAE